MSEKTSIFWNRWAIWGRLEKKEVEQQLWDGCLLALQGKAQTWELLSWMKGTQQGFKALFLGFLCIGKFLRVSKRSNNSSRLCPQRESIVGADGRHAQSSSAMKSAGIKGKKTSFFCFDQFE